MHENSFTNLNAKIEFGNSGVGPSLGLRMNVEFYFSFQVTQEPNYY